VYYLAAERTALQQTSAVAARQQCDQRLERARPPEKPWCSDRRRQIREIFCRPVSVDVAGASDWAGSGSIAGVGLRERSGGHRVLRHLRKNRAERLTVLRMTCHDWRGRLWLGAVLNVRISFGSGVRIFG